MTAPEVSPAESLRGPAPLALADRHWVRVLLALGAALGLTALWVLGGRALDLTFSAGRVVAFLVAMLLACMPAPAHDSSYSLRGVTIVGGWLLTRGTFALLGLD